MQVKYLQKLGILVLLSGIFLLVFLYLKKKITSNNIDTVNPTKATLFYSTFLSLGYNDTLAKYFTAQAAHESANFTSNIFNANNNAFGMKYAGQSIATGEKFGHAKYLSVLDSIKDFSGWYTRHRNKILSLPLYINSLSDYVDFLKNQKYFEADKAEYLKGCTYFYNMYFA